VSNLLHHSILNFESNHFILVQYNWLRTQVGQLKITAMKNNPTSDVLFSTTIGLNQNSEMTAPISELNSLRSSHGRIFRMIFLILYIYKYRFRLDTFWKWQVGVRPKTWQTLILQVERQLIFSSFPRFFEKVQKSSEKFRVFHTFSSFLIVSIGLKIIVSYVFILISTRVER